MSDDAIGLEPQGVEEMSYDQALEQIRSRQNFGLAVVAGLGAAIVGAILWAVVVYVTNYEIGLIAVAVGAVVGLAVRATGQGADQKFGILGAGCAALGWGLGTVLGDVALAAGQLGLPFGETLTTIDLTALVSTLASPMDLLFLGIAVFEGYKLSFRYRLG